MTAKEIYEIIDLNELPKEKADKLRELEVKTKGFSIQNDRVDETMRNLYAQLKEKKPSALKDLKVEIKKVETKKGDDVIIKETEEIVGKKKVTQKNPTPSSSKKETITEVAKKIRKEGEEWRQALRRAGEEMRKRDIESSKQVKTELQKLVDFVKNDPNFKDFPRTYGKGRKDIDLLKDASEKALAPGRRVSKKGHMNQYGASKGGRKYTENRDNRSDREASKFPKNIFLAKGGSVHRAELMEEGGQVFVPDQILANNPDALVNTTTMSQLFAEGGMAPTRKLFADGGALYQSDIDADYITYGEVLKSGGKLKYDPVRDVQAIVIQDGPLKKMFIKGDFLGGAYRLANGGLSEDYIYVSPRKVIFARLKSGEDIKPSNGFWIKKNASGVVYTGKDKAKPAFVKSKKFPLPKKITLSYPYKENEKIMKLLGEFSGKDDIRPAMTFVSIKDGELVSTNAHYLIRLVDPTTKGENELVCESKICQNIKKTDLKYPNVDSVIENFQADFSEQYDFVDLYESVMQARENVYEKLQRRNKNTFVVTNIELKNNDIKFDSGLLLQALKGAISLGMQKGFISYSEARSRAIVITPSEVATGPKYKGELRPLAGKDLILLMPIMGSGYEFESTIVAKQVMADGGEVFVPVQIDANNPNALVQTTTMSDLFADGGVMAKRGMVVTSIKDIPNFKQRLEEGKITYRGLGMGKLFDDFYDLAGESGTRIKVDGKEYFITDTEFDTFYRDADGRIVVRFDAPYRKGYADGGMMDDDEGVDLFEDYEDQPEEVQAILAKYELEDNDYNTLNDLQAELEEIGYTFEFDLDAEPYDLRKIGQKGKSEFYAKGGYVDLQANLMKELQKLQRELNSQRLSTYIEGDNSEEEMARQRERASKLARFNEILDLLRELESKKMADGGSIGFEKGGVVIYKELDLNRRDGKVKKTQITTAENYREALDKIKQLESKNKNPNVRYFTGDIYEKGGFVAMYGGKKINIEADSLYAAKLKAIEEFKVPKSKQGLLSVVSNKSMANQDFRFMEDGGRLEAQSLEMAQNISVQIAHHATELKEALEGKTYIEPWVTSMLQRAADNLSDATHYLEGKEDNMAKGGYVAVSEKDGYWYIMSQPTSKEEAQQVIEMGVPRGEMGKVVTLEEAKEYNKVIGREYLEKGGEVSVYNLRKGDKVKTRKGDIETILRKTGSGSYETLENDYSHSPESLEFISRPSRKMAKGGKIREFDDVLVISKNKLGMVEAIADNIYYVTTPFGETIKATMDDLKKVASFKEGGDVKIGEIATLAKENNATGDQVVKKISAGADVEMEHTEDRKMAMRIAVDHLKEDFNYYEKLRKAGL